jgi:hypothetical protein
MLCFLIIEGVFVNQTITWQGIEEMIQHWIEVSENGFRGSDYGYRDKIIKFVQEPINHSAVEKIISKMKIDIPPLKEQEVSLYWVEGDNQITINVDSNSVTIQLI